MKAVKIYHQFILSNRLKNGQKRPPNTEGLIQQWTDGPQIAPLFTTETRMPENLSGYDYERVTITNVLGYDYELKVTRLEGNAEVDAKECTFPVVCSLMALPEISRNGGISNNGKFSRASECRCSFCVVYRQGRTAARNPGTSQPNFGSDSVYTVNFSIRLIACSSYFYVFLFFLLLLLLLLLLQQLLLLRLLLPLPFVLHL